MNENKEQLTSQEEANRPLSVDVESVNEQHSVAPVLTNDENSTTEPNVEEIQTTAVDTGQVNLQKADNASEPIKMAVVLEKGRIYTWTELKAMRVIIVHKVDNRAVSPKEVDKKKSSIKAVGGLICSLTIIPASECPDIENRDGSEIKPDDPMRPYMFALAEGQHRFTAIEQLNAEGGKFEAYFTLPLCDASPNDILREANTTNYEWDGKSWLSSALSVAKKNKIEVPGLEWLQELPENKVISESAAGFYVTGKRVVSKAKLRIAVQKAITGDASALRDLVPTDTLENRKKLFETISKKFHNDKVIGLKVFPKTIYGFVDKLNATGKITGLTAMGMVEKFINNLTKTQVESITEAKKNKDKGLSKDVVITNLLTDMWDKSQAKA